MTQAVDFIKNQGGVIPAVLAIAVSLNLLLSAVSMSLQALHLVSPPWLQSVLGVIKKAIDILSANIEHPKG